MRRLIPILVGLSLLAAAVAAPAQPLPTQAEILATLELVNDVWIAQNPDAGNQDWAWAAYFTGHMELYAATQRTDYLAYAFAWAEANGWTLLSGPTTRNADRQCCGQTYAALYDLSPDPTYLTDITTSVEGMVDSSELDDWWWCDALYMAMPTFVRLGNIHGDDRYFAKLYDLFDDTRTARGLYDPQLHLWYRDESYLPPYTTPNGQPCFWSRGNGWVFAGLARVLDELPVDDPHRSEYATTFTEMADALVAAQQPDGFWYVSLADNLDYPGPETSGTAFFCYGLARGILSGRLDATTNLPAVKAAWQALSTVSVQPDGSVGYVQTAGREPASGQPVTSATTANFGVGAFLLAGCAVHELAGVLSPVTEAPVPALRAYPNPCNPALELAFTLAESGPTRLTVYDVRGRRVRTVPVGDLAAGPHVLHWDGRNEEHRYVAAGIYLVVLDSGRHRWQTTCTMVR